ncbi:hypothetical protein [Zwartia sp.]|uniref:hypothetical protein n=1 Tax=Zwartia sp. TaxID=2978004 RepID=UPI00271A0D87|nr:hypothetical protein [Zwartia sp.]MDO9025462.1 hypothetical protein [Zwartia sp.]
MKLLNNITTHSQLPRLANHRYTAPAVGAMVLALNIVAFSFAHAQEPSVVQELLELDTQAALLAARRNVVGPLSSPGPVVARASENLLLAIYGVGQSLTAEVLLGSEPYVFKSRRAQPISGRSIEYTLERIQPPCVHLKKEGRREVLCLGQVHP